MGIVDAAEFAQAAPRLAAPARRVNQLVLDDGPVQDIVLVDHQDVGNLSLGGRRLAVQELVHRDHAIGPIGAGDDGKACRVAFVGGREIDECEGDILRNFLKFLVFVREAVNRPIGFRLRIAVDRKPRYPIASRRRVVGEGGKGARLHRRRRPQVRRRAGCVAGGLRCAPPHAGEYAKQRRPGSLQPVEDSPPHPIEGGGAGLHDEGVTEAKRHCRELRAPEAKGKAPRRDRALLEEVVILRQNLDGQTRAKDLGQGRPFRRVVEAIAEADQRGRKQRQIVRFQTPFTEAAEKRIVGRFLVAVFDLQLGDRHGLDEPDHLRQPLLESLQRPRAAVEDEAMGTLAPFLSVVFSDRRKKSLCFEGR